MFMGVAWTATVVMDLFVGRGGLAILHHYVSEHSSDVLQHVYNNIS